MLYSFLITHLTLPGKVLSTEEQLFFFNKMEENLRTETKLQKFKDGVKEWVKNEYRLSLPSKLFQQPKPVRMRSIQHYFPQSKPSKQAAPLDDQAL